MHKGIFFCAGLITGTAFGYRKREQGLSIKLTRAINSFHDENKVKGPIPEPSLEQVFDLYYSGLLDKEQLKKFKKMCDLKQWHLVKDIIPASGEHFIATHPDLYEMRRERNMYYKR